MEKEFIKSSELTLQNGGYVSNKEGNPVSNIEFIQAQKHAEYVITFANKAKTLDFKGKKAVSVEDLKKEVFNELNKTSAIEFVKIPKVDTGKITNSLKNEALKFIEQSEKADNLGKVNEFLQQFSIISEFEKFGLFFEKDIVKLNKIYTIEEIKNAVTSVIDLLD